MTSIPKTISYWQLATIAVSLTVGLLIGLFLDSASGSATTSLTPMALIGFVISVLLGGASIVLAVVAISLGRASETALTARGDDSLRLQTEIYTKTADALQKIASSTDVTEKRIEDMISGRVSDISHDLARSLPHSRQSPQRLEEDIRRSIMHSIRSQESEAQRIEEKNQEEKREQEYQKAHKRALLTFANKQYLKVSKLEHGSVDDEGEDLFDGIYSRKDDKIALSTFPPSVTNKGLRLFLFNSLGEIRSGLIASLVIVLFSDDEHPAQTGVVEKVLALVPTDLRDRVQVISTSFADVESAVDAIDVANKPLNRSVACEPSQMEPQPSTPG